MPKSRGNSIASGSGAGQNGGTRTGVGGAGSPEETAQRLIERLSAIGPIDVPGESVSRGTVENIRVRFGENQGEANVESASGRTYQVNYIDDTCNCFDHRIRHNTCRHIQAAHRAVGRVLSQPESYDQPGRTMTVDELNNTIAYRQEIDRQEEDNRQDIQRVNEDDGFFYTENDDEFENVLERAVNESIEYEYENVLNGNDITFGLEIEFSGGNADAIARELYNLGICAYDSRVAYHARSVPGKWKLERDGSVSSGSQGGELVSPVLKDTPETWRTIEKICGVAKRHGARITGSCGGHVHMSAEPLDTAKQRWKRLFRTIGGFEDVIYRLAGGTEGRVRMGSAHYARSFLQRAITGVNSRFEMNSDGDINNLTRNISEGDRYYGVNLTNIYNSSKPNTVELRYFNSSLEPTQLQANVKIAAGIMMAAQKARVREGSEQMIKRGNLLRNQSLGANNRSDHSAIKKLVDIIFTRKKDKDKIISVYAKNQWRN
jgi:hypothetical protein